MRNPVFRLIFLVIILLTVSAFPITRKSSDASIHIYSRIQDQGVVISQNGNVGINTSSATEALTVSGNGLFAGTITANRFVGNGSGLTNLPIATANLALTSNIAISMNAQGLVGAISVATGNTIMSITISGNVGIGTASPTSKFEVQGGTASAGVSGLDIRLTAQNGGTGGARGGTIYLLPGSGTSSWPNGTVEIGPAAGLNVIRHANDAYTNSSTSSKFPPLSILIKNDYNYNNTVAFNGYEVRNASGLIQYGYFGAASLTGAANYTPALVWGQSTGASAYSERMRIDQNGNLGIGTSTPNSTLHVVGSIGFKVVSTNSSSYTAGNETIILANASGAGITIALPVASTCTDRVYTVKKTDSSVNTVTLDPNGSELIEGVATKILGTLFETVTIISDGTAWWII